MAKVQAYQTGSITEAVVAFAAFARAHGLNTGIQETRDALEAAATGILSDRNGFKCALKAIFCNSPEECLLYDQLFMLFWDTNPVDRNAEKARASVQGNIQKKTNASLVMLGRSQVPPREEEEARNVTGANEAERLKKTDLSLLSEMESDQLEEIARRLFREMAVRMRRRTHSRTGTGDIHLRRTIRNSLGSGGEPIDLFYRTRKPKKKRLIVLLDVSGSMDKYSFFLLRFIYALREQFRQLEAFIFSTSLKRVTPALKSRQMAQVLRNIGEEADNWSSGTRIGLCLKQFSELYGKRMLNGSPVVLILSDGLDTGDPSLLGAELSKIKQRSKRVIWLNPLKGMKGYEPLARGMQAALPSIDDFRSAHNLESLLELEKLLDDA